VCRSAARWAARVTARPRAAGAIFAPCKKRLVTALYGENDDAIQVGSSYRGRPQPVVRRWSPLSRRTDACAVMNDPRSFLPAMSVADGDWVER
jgi:hypothetical protein